MNFTHDFASFSFLGSVTRGRACQGRQFSARPSQSGGGFLHRAMVPPVNMETEIEIKLRIPLAPYAVPVVRAWIKSFKAHEENWMSYPSIRRTQLYVTAPCLPFLLAYADTRHELEIRRLRGQATAIIERALATARGKRSIHSLKVALDNLGRIRPGEFLSPSFS
jgi:hypothetical protein